MACQGCGAENRLGSRFCRDCGAPLSRACASCGTALEVGARFCDQCGAPAEVSAEPTSAAGIRRADAVEVLSSAS
jgi:predicted amidophosphoribosyltransferase